VSDLKHYQIQQKIDLQIYLQSLEFTVVTDASLLRAALYQLLLNAINFNKAGGYIHVHADFHNDQLYIDVVDSGIGIAQTELETIFQAFHQVEDHNTRSKNGLGLGLSIAQGAISKLSGTLSVESVLGEGTTFHIQLPLNHQAPRKSRLRPICKRNLLSTSSKPWPMHGTCRPYT